jgi:hypothetical protein
MKNFFFFTLLFSSFITVAQETKTPDGVEYSISEPFAGIPRGTGGFYPIGYKKLFAIKGEVHAFQYFENKFSFLKYSGPSLNEVRRNEVAKGEDFDIEGIEELNGRHYFFFSRWQKSTKSETLFMREIDFEKGDFAGPEKLLYESNGKLNGVEYPKLKGAAYPKFNRATSKDGSKLMVAHTPQLSGKEQKVKNQSIGIHVYDESMNELWNRALELPYLSENASILTYCVDQKGNVYILTKLYNSRTDADSSGGSHLVTFIVNGETGTVTNVDVGVKKKFIKEVQLIENDNGQIIICGLYGNDAKLLFTSGVFKHVINEEGEVLNSIQLKIPNSVVAKYDTDRMQKKIENADDNTTWSFRNLILRNAISESDGSVSLFAERTVVIKTQRTNSRGTTFTRSEIIFGNILIANLGSDSESSLLEIIPRHQYSLIDVDLDQYFFNKNTTDDFGFVPIKKQDKTFVIFLDNNSNLNLPENEEPKKHASTVGGFLVAYKIDNQSGSKENISFFDTRNAKGKALTKFSIEKVLQLSENEIAIEFATDVAKKNVMVKVNLPD